MKDKYIRIGSTPQHLARDVELDVTIQLTFSEIMVKDTVEDSTKITLYKGNKKIPSSYHYAISPFERTLSIKPKANLESGTTYLLKVHSGESGPLGGIERNKTVQSDHQYVFTTKDAPIEEPGTGEETDPVEPEIPSPEPEKPPVDKEPTEPEDSSGVIFDPLEDELNNLHLTESFPESGDLVDLDSHMVFNFNKPINKATLQENIFVKENRINPLLEKLNKDKLIKGVVEAGNGTEEDKEFTFKPTEVLKPGVEYQVVIRKDLHEELNYDIRINFQTLFERMFADVDTVRLVLGAFADRLTDLDLAKLINQQSNSIYQLASMMGSFNESDWAQENGVIVTFPYAASQYVVYSTAYYAILGRSLEGSSGMSESIKLADLSVSASNESSDNLSDLLELLKAEFERWWNVLQGEAEEVDPDRPNPNYTMTIATRGGDEAPYPDFQTRVPFNELGGRDS